jgi:hypothetical protein
MLVGPHLCLGAVFTPATGCTCPIQYRVVSYLPGPGALPVQDKEAQECCNTSPTQQHNAYMLLALSAVVSKCT